MTTLLERWDSGRELMDREQKEIRRALAIAQAVDGMPEVSRYFKDEVLRRADELLEAKNE